MSLDEVLLRGLLMNEEMDLYYVEALNSNLCIVWDTLFLLQCLYMFYIKIKTS